MTDLWIVKVSVSRSSLWDLERCGVHKHYSTDICSRSKWSWQSQLAPISMPPTFSWNGLPHLSPSPGWPLLTSVFVKPSQEIVRQHFKSLKMLLYYLERPLHPVPLRKLLFHPLELKSNCFFSRLISRTISFSLHSDLRAEIVALSSMVQSST